MIKLIEKKYIGGGFNIVAQGTFLECLEEMQKGNAHFIYGPKGGILRLDEIDRCLVYHSSPERPPRFSVENYLGIWRILVFDHEMCRMEENL